jgi:hypothetical protein
MRILPVTLAAAAGAAVLSLGSAAPAQAAPQCGTPIHGNLVNYTLCMADYFVDRVRPDLPPLPPHTEPPELPLGS